MLILAAIVSATDFSAIETGESGCSTTTGLPESPPERTCGSIGIEPKKQLPKRNKRVGTPAGEGKVVDVLPLKDAVLVEMENGIVREYQRIEIQPLDELEAFQKKAESPCSKHPDGNCDCGRKGKPNNREFTPPNRS